MFWKRFFQQKIEKHCSPIVQQYSFQKISKVSNILFSKILSNEISKKFKVLSKKSKTFQKRFRKYSKRNFFKKLQKMFQKCFLPNIFPRIFKKVSIFFSKTVFIEKKFKKISNIFPKRFLTNFVKKFGIFFKFLSQKHFSKISNLFWTEIYFQKISTN